MTRREYWERRLGRARTFGSTFIADLLGCSRRTVQRRVATGELRGRGGKQSQKHIRIDRDDLLEFLIAQETRFAD